LVKRTASLNKVDNSGSVNNYGAATSDAKLPILDASHNKLDYTSYVITALESTSIYIIFHLDGTNNRDVKYWHNGVVIAQWGPNSSYQGVNDSRIINLEKGDTFYITDYNHGDGWSPSFSCTTIYID
jgi:hypothetical protein